MMKCLVPVAAALILTSCQTAENPDSGGVDMGAGGCHPSDPAATRIDWRPFGATPMKTVRCKYGNREQEFVSVRGRSGAGKITRELLYTQYVNIADTQGILFLLESIQGLDALPSASAFRTTSGPIGDIQYVPVSIKGRQCVYFRTSPEAGEELTGSGVGVQEIFHGLHCDVKGIAASLQKIRKLKLSNGPIPIGARDA